MHEHEDSSPPPPTCLDAESLIGEIKKRPALWDRTSPDFNDRFVKAKQWKEVHEAIFEDWKDLGSAEKRLRGEEVKKKWRNFRDTYAKDLVNQKKAKKGKAKRKRPYRYFEELSFLRGQSTEKKKESSTESSGDEDYEPKRKSPKKKFDGVGSEFFYIDKDILIREVKKRPVLWTRQSKISEYNERRDRSNLWDEVCEMLFEDWSELNSPAMALRRVEVKKKWRHLRNSYGRELTIHKKVELGVMKPKKPYRYFDDLSFLFGSLEKKDDFSYIEGPQVKIEVASSNYSISEYESDTQELAKHPTADETNVKTYDEDVCFSEMLIPMLKRLNEDQKHYAQVKILNVLKRARQFDPLGQVLDSKFDVKVES